MAKYDHIELPGGLTARRVGSVDFPVYAKRRHDPSLDGAASEHSSHLWLIECDEGWSSTVVCSGMYEWAADWLLKVIDGRPFATKERP